MYEQRMTNSISMEERSARGLPGVPIAILNTLLLLVSVGILIWGAMIESAPLLVIGILYAAVIAPFLYGGLRVMKPNEAMVLTVFGKYTGTLKGPGCYFVNPFSSAVAPAGILTTSGSIATAEAALPGKGSEAMGARAAKVRKISLKAMTLNNDKQKINDQMGNPIIIGIVVIWRVVNTAKAVFNVDNYTEYLSTQCDSALRNIVRLYPYDVSGDGEGTTESLRGSSQEIADRLRQEIQDNVTVAGLEILDARITHLAYAPEIAAAMLQRQQATAVVDARQMIVDGAVGMVEMALAKLNDKDIVHLDEERKAAMVSNLLVVLCGNKDAQPIVNSGSLY